MLIQKGIIKAVPGEEEEESDDDDDDDDDEVETLVADEGTESAQTQYEEQLDGHEGGASCAANSTHSAPEKTTTSESARSESRR